MAGVGELAHPGHHLVFVGQDVVEHRRAVARDRRRACRHGQRDAGLGTLHVVGTVLGFGHAVFGVRRFVGADHQAVFEPQVLELEGLQQGSLAGDMALGGWVAWRRFLDWLQYH